jgi:flagellin
VYGAEQGRQVPGTTGGSATYATATVGTSGQIGPGDVLSGSIVLNNTSGIQQTFTIGSTYLVNGASVTTGGDTLQDLVTAIGEDAALGVNASAANGFLNLQSSSLNTSITVGNGNPAGITLVDRLTATASAPSTGAPGGTSTATVQLAGGQTTAASGDTITGSISLTGATGTKAFVMGGSSSTGTIAVGSTAGGETLGALADAITNSGIGIIATVTSAGLSLMGATENGTAITKGFDTLQDSTATAALAYTPVSGYDLGISNSTLAGRSSVYDSSTGQSATGTNANFSFNSVAGNGVATMSYSDGAGQSLSATDLSNQTDAETALNDLNTAIMDVAAQDGYIGAQINTLNSVSQVMTTQQENVVSAQNAIQATDYASATSNMSKYEILSQTGIAALAQANSVQQEVTKLLQ